MPRVISVGRLDLTSEGLLLLTNDGELARKLELPANGWLRRYRARAFRRVTQKELDTLKNGITVEGVRYGSIDAKLERGSARMPGSMSPSPRARIAKCGACSMRWGCSVNRLMRTSYGPFQLGTLQPGTVEEIPRKVLREQLGKDAL